MIKQLVESEKIKVGNRLDGYLIVAVHHDYIWVTLIHHTGNARIVGGKVDVKPLAYTKGGDFYEVEF